MLGHHNAREHMTLASTAMINLQSSWQSAALQQRGVTLFHLPPSLAR